MEFLPIKLMMQRVERFGAQADSLLFGELLYAGEFISKLTTAAFIAAIEDDREHHRYRLMHGLVRADGIGEWSTKLDEVLTGPASQHLTAAAKEDRQIYNVRVGMGSWQYEAAYALRELLAVILNDKQPPVDKLTVRAWFSLFAEVRNKTRGHGATTPATCARIAPLLKQSIQLMCENSPIFKRPWAYLHRNLSGKYNVVQVGGDVNAFAHLKTTAARSGEHHTEGLYIVSSGLRRIELVHTDLNVSDFYFPNGGFNGKQYELHSLISDNRLDADAAPYLTAAGSRPTSETHGKTSLDVVGKVWANLPAVPSGYVQRPQLETAIKEVILNDRHPIVTLVGRGGIGKTSLALKVLHEVAQANRYDIILWFSARDIDLSISGPQIVQPQVLTDIDIANEFKALAGASAGTSDPKQNAVMAMSEHLRRSPLGSILFVFDNFETVRNPVDLFQWIDNNIRLPNKVMITSRFRDFKADYPIEISGMENAEAETLISQMASTLNIESIITTRFREQVIEESGGHPYVIKIILGEVADTNRTEKPRQLMVRKDEILDALFDRTFSNLSPIASRMFLVLSGWRSLVPQLALEAALLRNQLEGGDPSAGAQELIRMSLVERKSAPDGTDFLEVPLTATLFGLKKLAVSPNRAIIDHDIRFLQDIGATSAVGLKEGIAPRIQTFFRRAARRIGEGTSSFEEVRPVMEFMARGYLPAWLLLAELQQEVGGAGHAQRAAEYVRRYLEGLPDGADSQDAWRQLTQLYRQDNNVLGACSAFLEVAATSMPPLHQVSDMANWLNTEKDVFGAMEVADRRTVFGPMAGLMERYLAVASASDLSRLAWLHLNAGNENRALRIAEIGLEREPSNMHCQRLVERLAG